MQQDMQLNDIELTASDIRQIENADELAHFFAKLGYNVDQRVNIANYAALGLNDAELRQLIYRIELIGHDPADGDITIYLLEVRSVTARLRNEIARRFRDRPEQALLVLTKDYEQLEFVLLQKGEERRRSTVQPLKLVVRPLPLTMNRRNPGPLALRVLKRFTFTEDDAAYQWEKLRSAYVLAEWSEEYFNNRALFSDYYLKQRLTDKQLTPEWGEDVRPIGMAIHGKLATARKAFTGQPEQQVRPQLYEPLFQQLGFAYAAQKPGDSAAPHADYMLYAPTDMHTPLAAALTYVWNRNLDDVDETRDAETPDEIPGALVVSLLEAQVAPWVIVTNGKLWRLYSATASNKATNYYEVDLEEALAASDQLTALKYWWLLFRRQSFPGFLDALLKNSADYAKELGDRLKDRVFVEIFPQFARGFIANMRANGASQLDAAGLAQVFSGTLTFLYRLMFLLYAESLELLPVNEANGYREQSLYRLKGEIASAGGTVYDQAAAALDRQYSASATGLYERLTALFTVIDQGSDALNMPTYNGGLFSAHTASGQFLNAYAIPDRFLARGLDRLARDVDARTRGLVFIDFKSLGVRQLGSIYEGLLEFKLRIAAEALAVTREKGKEVYAPVGQVKKPLATLAPGDVYLENDKRERKATGSYYTPDYIVKYIVQHTVGPVLDRKFAELVPRLRAAQKGYRDYAAMAAARHKSSGKPELPAVYWNSPAMQQLVDDCLNIRCLDPAMGSGHFLVEVVDYVSNRLISFLNGWSENPVWAFIERTRADILGEMERQHVTIDAERLTRVALLKRAVLKRCVYGVDLNEMAVELAKVSLWLDAFTLGAPLSFLDHHLKHGNSLIGARVQEVQAYAETNQGETRDMFAGSKFAGVMLATDLMRQVSYLSDNTVEQTRRSAEAYRDASDHLAPYKRLLDVYTSRWFGNAPTKKVKSDYVRLFLQEPQTEAWLQNPAAPLDDRLIPATQIVATALQAAADKRFFHWELEFPEVFFAPRTPGGQDVQLVESGGFDAVVGNPPYLRIQNLQQHQPDQVNFFSQQFNSSTGKYDIYVLFAEKSRTLATTLGRTGMIVPNKWIVSDYGSGIRKYFAKHLAVRQVVDFD
ncbi:MAG: Eco57I restriction-modification methylase domain-containing protein [Chloroflexi bacterium SZAS-1]|nr:Eco57I restriction-modification methylase domain-containing protein [Chloroflexi bacterium SZAS-1]